MPGAWSDFEKQHQEMANERAREEPAWRDIARFLRPDGQEFNSGERRERDSRDDPFDSTALYAIDDFTGGLFVKANNPAERWCSLWLGDDFAELEKYRPVKAWLQHYENALFNSLNPAVDNFYLSVQPWFADMGAFATGFMWDEEVPGENRFNCQAVPVGECYKATDAAGNTNCFHRRFRLSGRQAQGKWRGRAPQMRDDEQAEFIHVLMKNPGYVAGVPGPRGKPWKSCIVSPDKRDFYFESPGGGFFELPVHEIEWSKRSGRAWATGPGHNALSDMRGNDELTRSMLVGSQFDNEPMLLVRDEDIMTSADINPNGLLYGGLTDQGKRQVEYLERKNSPQTTLNERQVVRGAIQRAFRFSLASILAQRPQMTAEEVATWKTEDLKMLAPNLVRIQRGQGSFVTRRAAMLWRMGAIRPPPPELARYGAMIRPRFSNPFEKAQLQEKAQGVTRWTNTLVSLATETQNPAWLDPIDNDGVADVLHDAFTGLPEVKRDPREVQQIRQNRAAAQAAQAQAEQDAMDADTTATLAHARQADTRAAERTGARR